MMRILLLTNKSDVTTDFIVRNLNEKNIPFYRLNTEEIGKSIELSLNFSKEIFKLYDKNLASEIDLLKFKSVYFRRPELNLDFGEANQNESNFLRSEMLFILEGIYKILDGKFWLNNLNSLRNAENKLYQLMVAKEVGLQIPESLVSNQPKQVMDFFQLHESNCILKPVKSGLIEGKNEGGVIFTTQIHLNHENVERISSCPIYIQPLIKKKGDIRVTIVGTKIFPAFIHSENVIDAKSDWRQSDQELEYSKLSLPVEIESMCFALMKKLNLNFGALDFLLDENNQYIFLEINPNGQWAWIEKRLNYKISDEITKILEEQTL